VKPKLLLLTFLLAAFGLQIFSSRLDSYVVGIVIKVGITIVLAVSLNLINGHTGQFSLGHAGFMAVGAYTCASFSMKIGSQANDAFGFLSPVLRLNISFFIFLLAGGLTAAIAGLLVGLPSLRLKGDYLAIVTLGFGEIIRVIVINTPSLGGALGLTNIPAHTNIFWSLAFAALTVYVVGAAVHSTYGRGFIAVHDDEIAAEATGINPTRFKIRAFVIGAFFAGVAGGLGAHFDQNINPEEFGFMRSIELVVIVILGGMGKNVGVILAAILLTVLPEYLRAFNEYRNITYSALLILLMLLCPQGFAQIWSGILTGFKKLCKK